MGSKSPVATGKAAAFAADAKEAGWEVSHKQEGDRETVSATGELDGAKAALSLVWDKDRYNYSESSMTVDGHSRTVRNASEARRILSGEMKVKPGKPTHRNFVKKANAAAKALQKSDGSSAPIETKPRPAKRLPFDLEAATDEEILEAVIGKRITWRNSRTGNYDAARVMSRPKQNHLKIVLNVKNERCLNWAEADDTDPRQAGGGFRSVKLSSIISITSK